MSFNTFDNLIFPTDLSTFFSKYWEQVPLVISRGDPVYYSHLFSMRDVENVIYYTEGRFPVIQIFNKGKSVINNSVKENPELHNLHEIYAEYNKGSTVILRGLQHYCKRLADFSRSLETFFNHRVHINMYMTPSNSQCFTPHFDTHEVFILQIEGSKRWRIYDTFQLIPLPINQKELPEEKLQKPIQEVILNAGDLLYIPSGYVHEALTSEFSSLHLTVGIKVYRWIDLLSTALILNSEQDISLRKSLPIGFLKDDNCGSFLKQKFEELLETSLKSANIEDTIIHLRKRVIEDMLPIPNGHFTQADNINFIDLDTILKKRKGVVCHIFKEQNSVYIQFPGNTVKAPKYIEPALHFIINTEEFSVSSLPDLLNNNNKLILARQLVREGLLTHAS